MVVEWLWLQVWVGDSVSAGVSDVRVGVLVWADGVTDMDTVSSWDRVRQEREREVVEVPLKVSDMVQVLVRLRLCVSTGVPVTDRELTDALALPVKVSVFLTGGLRVWEAVRDREKVVVHEAEGLWDAGLVGVKDCVRVDVGELEPVGWVEDSDGVVVIVRVRVRVLLTEPRVADDGVAVPLRENVCVTVMLRVGGEGRNESVTLCVSVRLCVRKDPVGVVVRVGTFVRVGGVGLDVALQLSDALPGLLVKDFVNGLLEVAEAEAGLRDNV